MGGINSNDLLMEQADTYESRRMSMSLAHSKANKGMVDIKSLSASALLWFLLPKPCDQRFQKFIRPNTFTIFL